MQVPFNRIPNNEQHQPNGGMNSVQAAQPEQVKELEIEHLELVSGGAAQQVDAPKTGW